MLALRQTEFVPDFCTCGAELPPDARFCHKCGKPQREEPLLVQDEVVPPPPPPSPPEAPRALPIDFRNSVAVRIGLFMAVMASLLIGAPLVGLACPLWLIGAGFGCVYLYQRRTGELLSVQNGARLGWITGVFSSVIVLVMTTMTIVGLLRADVRSLQENPQVANIAGQLQKFAQQPFTFVLGLLFALLVMFVAFAALGIAGGALGAKLLGKQRTSAL